MSDYLALYNSSAVIRFPLVKRNSVDLAIKADYTPANGDVNISKDGGAQANPANSLNIVTGTTWNITLSAAELTAKEVIVMVRNNTAVEDQWVRILTYGNASAFLAGDVTANNVPADLRQIVGTSVAAPAQNGVIDANIKNVNNVTANSNLAADLRQIVGAAVSGPATAGVLDVNIKNVNNSVHNANVAQYGASLVSVVANAITNAGFNANAINGRVVANDVDIRNVNGNVTVGTIATNAIKETTFDATAGSFFPLAISDQGVAQNSTAASLKIRSGAPFGANEIVGSRIVLTSGNGAGQSRVILSYNNANNTAAVDTWTTTPSNNASYKIFADDLLTADAVINRLNSNVVVNSVVGNVGNVTGNVGGSLAGSVGSVTNNVTVGSMTVNSLKQFFNVNSTTNYASSVAGSVVKEIADNAGGSSLTVDSIIARLNSNVVVNTVVNSVGSVSGDVSGNVSGSLGSITANVAKQFFNLNSGVTYANAVAGSVVKETADNAGSSNINLNVQSIIDRLNGNVVVNTVLNSVGSVVANVNTQFVANNGIFAASFNSNALTGRAVANDVDIRNVNGNVTVGTLAANSITATVFNSNAITERAYNSNAISGRVVFNDVDIRAVNQNVGNVTGNIGGNVAGSVASVTGNIGNVTGNIGGNLAGSVGSVTGNVGNVTGNLGGTVASVINLNAQLVDAAVSTRATPAQVKTQVVAALATDTYASPAQGTPPAGPDLASKISYLYKFAISKVTQTNNTLSVFNADASTVDHKATVSDDNTTYTRGNIVSGP
jgi:hypothetical protein